MSVTTTESGQYVFLVKNNEAFAQRASISLTESGYHPISICDFQVALTEVEVLKPAMIVIDYGLARQPAIDFCQRLRIRGKRFVILILLNQENIEERVIALESGADDYLVKPYSTKEFMNLVELYLEPQVLVQEQLKFADLVLDLTTRQILRDSRVIDLTMKEFELLKYLMSYPEKVLTREQILENVWGYDFRGESNVIEVYIRYLRLKIEDESNKRLIQTVRGVGYVLRADN